VNSLREAVDNFLEMRRVMGFKVYVPGLMLRDFASFLEREGVAHITTELALRWAKQPKDSKPSHWQNRLGVVRGFARHMSAFDSRTEIPPPWILPPGSRRRTPHIYSDEEIMSLIEAAERLSPATVLRRRTCSTLIGLLAATGMRLGEACALERKDVDLDQGILTIRKAKFGKSRLVPVHTSTRSALERYAHRRDLNSKKINTPHFFVSDKGMRMSEESVWTAFVRVSNQIGLRNNSEGRRPRLHDLRHTFAVKTLVRWYREGLDVERRIPILSTYLGHARMHHTYWYFSATPELLGAACERLAKSMEDRS